MRKILMGLVAALIVGLSSPSHASVAHVSPAADVYSHANIIFTGKAVSYELAPRTAQENERNTPYFYYITLEVNRVLKGQGVPSIVKIRMNNPLIDPGNSMVPGLGYTDLSHMLLDQTYLVSGVVGSFPGHPKHVQPFGIALKQEDALHHYSGTPVFINEHGLFETCENHEPCTAWAQYIGQVRFGNNPLNPVYNIPVTWGGE